MRVLLVTDWPRVDGGVETYLAQVAAGLRRRGDDVLLLASSAGRGASEADVVVRSSERLAAKALLQLENPFARRAARRAVRAFRPDVAHVSMFELLLSPGVVAGLGAVPYVLNVAYYKPVCPTGLKLLPSGALCRDPAGPACRRHGCVGRAEQARSRVRYARIGAVVHGAAAVLTCSRWMARALARDGVEAAHVPWPVLPPGPGFARRPAAEPLFVAVGRLAPEKGLDTLLDALAVLRGRGVRARLRVVGEGPERPALEARVARSGVEVEWAGRVPHEGVERHLADAWALVAPSRWAEPLGLTAIEAIVRRVPVVASAAGGYAETVEEDVTGLLFPNGDAAALADRLQRVATGAALTGGVPEAAAKALATRHDEDAHVDALRLVLAGAASSP